MITDKEKGFLVYWDRQRQKGRWRYAFITGVLFWGIPVYLFLQLFYYLFRDNYTFETGRFAMGLIIWMIMGFLGFGLITWWMNERSYNKIKTKNPDT